MKLYLNDNLVCNREAKYGKESNGLILNDAAWETIDSYTSCDAIKLTPGDKVKMTTDYDLREHKL
jgi:hypothetical protein